jgi:hypothetical protein
MVSFAQLLEQLQKEKSESPLMGSGEENGQIMAVLKAGNDLHNEKETSFWDEFISLCSNAEGLSQLLGVSKEKVNSWPSKIKEGINDLKFQPVDGYDNKRNKKMIATASTGAVTVNQDPNMGEIL